MIDITAKLSYLERFQKQTKQTKSIVDELVEVKKTLARLEAAEVYASEVLSTVKLYEIIGQGMVPSIQM
jgi:hypothetical protein